MKTMTCSDYYEDVTYLDLNSATSNCQNSAYEIEQRMKLETNTEVLEKLRDCLSAIKQAEEALDDARAYLEEVIDDTQLVYEYSDR